MNIKNLYPDIFFDSINDISVEFLKSKNIKGVILDIDNTLIGHNEEMPDKNAMTFIKILSDNDIKICVVSNNSESRVSLFCQKIGVKNFVYKALKPKAEGYKKAAEIMKLSPFEIASIGDQIFTDVWGGNRANCYTILLKPIHKGNENPFIAIKRLLEKPIIKKIKKTQ